MRYILAAIIYIVSGWVMGRLIEKYMRELETKLNNMNERSRDLFIYIGGPLWIAYALLIIGGLLWPISDIMIVARAEWKYACIIASRSEAS